MGLKWTVIVFTVLAVVELIADQFPSTPARTRVMGLSARIVTGALTGVFGGYYARVGLVRSLRVPDVVIAIPEDAIALGLGLFLVSRL